MYYRGLGVPLNYTEAVRWTRSAAEAGDALAQTDLGFLYEQSKGVPLDYTLAYMWYALGAKGGDPRAIKQMKQLSSLMTRNQVDEAKIRVATWLSQNH